MSIQSPDYIKTLNPYKAGNQGLVELQKTLPKIINLASNENPLGGSPKALEAMVECAGQIALYPDPGGAEIVQAIADYEKVSPDRIVCGHGSESLIAHTVNSFADLGDEVLTGSSTFVGIFVKTNKLGRVIRTVPLKDYTFDLEAIYNAISDKTKIIYLANPNNPTGTMFNKSEFDEFITRVPENIVVVLDEAYYHYSHNLPGYPDGLDYNYPNLLILRTFSKSHGLAGLRVGYAIGPVELIQTIYKVKLPFEPSIIAQKAATAAVGDDDFVRLTVETNKVAIQMLQDKLTELGAFFPTPVVANFLIVIFPFPEIAVSFAGECFKRGILVRHTASFGLPQGVRISTGTVGEMEYALEIIEEVYLNLKRQYNF